MENNIKKEVKNKVYKYIVNHEYVSPNKITEAINVEDGLLMLDVLSELRKEGYIRSEILPIDLKNNESVRYIVTTKKYRE